MQTANDVRKKEITFTDADGKEVKKTVKEILKDRLPSKKDWENFKMLPDAPGITILIMNMGLELAQIEQKRAESRLTQFSTRAILFEDAYISLKLAEHLISDAQKTIESKNDKETPFISIANAWQAAMTSMNEKPPKFEDFRVRTDAIAARLIALRKEALAESIIARNESLFKVTIARLDHQDSINESIRGILYV